jgi:hypothetical protein
MKILNQLGVLWLVMVRAEWIFVPALYWHLFLHTGNTCIWILDLVRYITGRWHCKLIYGSAIYTTVTNLPRNAPSTASSGSGNNKKYSSSLVAKEYNCHFIVTLIQVSAWLATLPPPLPTRSANYVASIDVTKRRQVSSSSDPHIYAYFCK